MESTPSITVNFEEFTLNNNHDRVLGRILAVEELSDVSGGWTLGSAGDTAKSKDTGAYQVDASNCFLDSMTRPEFDNLICPAES
jgi:hypothetical protein